MLKPSHGIFNLLRHRRRRQTWRDLWDRSTRLWLLPLYLALISAAHVVAMMALEGMTLLEGIWLTATTVVTVGYGDLSAETPAGRIATMLLMYVGAIFVVAVAVNNWLDARAAQSERKAQGAWRWNLEDHVVIIGSPERDATAFFARLARQIRHARDWSATPIQLLTASYADVPLPQALRDLGVVHFSGRADTQDDLEACRVDRARGVIVLAGSETDGGSDARTFDIVDRVRESGYRGPIVAECVNDENRPRLSRAGATSIVRPMRGFPEALTRALFAPGAEQVIENLFTAEGDECLLVALSRPWRSRWVDLVTAVVASGVGTPIAYRAGDGRISTNPSGLQDVEADALFVVVHDRDEGRARETIDRLAAAAGR